MTFCGYSAPPQWCDGHHLVHWADHGPTDLNNAALLCERHHTIVHSRRLAGHIAHDHGAHDHGAHDHAGGLVRWNLTRGSYDDLLRDRGVPPLRA